MIIVVSFYSYGSSVNMLKDNPVHSMSLIRYYWGEHALG
jgi:hypothetical protein